MEVNISVLKELIFEQAVEIKMLKLTLAQMAQEQKPAPKPEKKQYGFPDTFSAAEGGHADTA